MRKYIFRLISVLVVLLFALSVNAQYGMSEAQLPFQSTSTMRMSGSQYSSTPTINEHGTAVCGNTPNRVEQRRVSTSPGTPGPGEVQQPIGDLPIAILIGLLWIYARIRSKKV